jgi:colanic acid biosynthesis glycosyl transferase WcaI
MKLLLTTAYYWPEMSGNAPYVTGAAEYLASKGHDVRVVTGFAHYPSWSLAGGATLAAREERNGVSIVRRIHYVPRSQTAARRALYESSLFVGGLSGLPFFNRPDLVVGVTPTLSGAALAAIAGRLYRRPYALVFQDLMGRAAAQSGIIGGSGVAAFVERIERRLAAGAAAVGVIAGGFADYFTAIGISPDRIITLRNWNHVGTVAPPRREHTGRARPLCVHAGNLGHKQGLDNVLEAARRLGDQVDVLFVGDGNDRERLQRKAMSQRLTNVSFVGPKPQGEYETVLAAADILLVNQRGSVADMSLASKLTSYFAAGRPVVAAVAPGSATAREVEAAGAGVVVEPDDPGALATSIEALINHPARRLELGENGRRFAENELAEERALAAYESFVSYAVDRGRTR